MAKKVQTLGEFEFPTLAKLQEHLVEAKVDESTCYFVEIFDKNQKVIAYTYEYHKK